MASPMTVWVWYTENFDWLCFMWLPSSHQSMRCSRSFCTQFTATLCSFVVCRSVRGFITWRALSRKCLEVWASGRRRRWVMWLGSKQLKERPGSRRAFFARSCASSCSGGMEAARDMAGPGHSVGTGRGVQGTPCTMAPQATQWNCGTMQALQLQGSVVHLRYRQDILTDPTSSIGTYNQAPIKCGFNSQCKDTKKFGS